MSRYYRAARRSALLPAARAASLLLAVLLGACTPAPAPDEAVRQWVAAAQAAAEERDRSRLLDMVSPAYADARGNGRDDIDRMLRALFLRNRNILLLSKVDDLDLVDDSAATVLVTVGMAGSVSGIGNLSADAYRFELELVARDDRWLLIGARWGEVGGPLR